jgi:hypothetical protein
MRVCVLEQYDRDVHVNVSEEEVDGSIPGVTRASQEPGDAVRGQWPQFKSAIQPEDDRRGPAFL